MELAQRGKGDTWQVEHLAQDDELEFGVEDVYLRVWCVSGEDKEEFDE